MPLPKHIKFNGTFMDGWVLQIPYASYVAIPTYAVEVIDKNSKDGHYYPLELVPHSAYKSDPYHYRFKIVDWTGKHKIKTVGTDSID